MGEGSEKREGENSRDPLTATTIFGCDNVFGRKMSTYPVYTWIRKGARGAIACPAHARQMTKGAATTQAFQLLQTCSQLPADTHARFLMQSGHS